MINFVNGDLFRAMLDGGIRNLALHGKEINDLNVFPVPDGDTGTNMVLTLRNGYSAIGERTELCDVAEAFSSAVVYGARGNSGVIISRFFKGFSRTLASAERGEADAACLTLALSKGTEDAYRAVSHPTEGTMLTVLREATERVATLEGGDILLILEVFLEAARESLANTPNLLPVLKQAGVVDSGGAGVVCIFEGMYKHLTGEIVAAPAFQDERAVDYSRFNRQSRFDYGYCTEFLLQLTDGKATDFDADAFRRYLEGAGDSVATTFDEDKVKVHIHTAHPERILAEAHRFGEFLSLKIENMSVQHSESETVAEEEHTADEGSADKTATLCLPEVCREGSVGIVVCAPDRKTAELFFSMGADAILLCPTGAAPTTKDFADAVGAASTGGAVIFTNNKNFVLSASGASELLTGDRSVEIVGSDSIAECYAALAMLDFYETDAARVAEDARSAIENLHTVTVKQAVKDAVCDGVQVNAGDYLAISRGSVIGADEEIWELVKGSMNRYVESHGEPDAITVFTGMHTPEGLAEMIVNRVNRKYKFTEADVVETHSETCRLILSFE